MSINPIDENSTPKTTGSLEELFRHHLGEEAAVPPRPMLWEQIDNSLLIRQNELYRRRLVATRWVAAASLLLATLTGTGWWAGRHELMGGAEVATAGRPNPSVASGTGYGRSSAADAASNTRELAGLAGAAGSRRAAGAARRAAATTSGVESPSAAPAGAGANAAGRATGAAFPTSEAYAATHHTNAAAATPGRYTGVDAARARRYSTGRLAASASYAKPSHSLPSGAATTAEAGLVAAQATHAVPNPALDAREAARTTDGTLAPTATGGVTASSVAAGNGAASPDGAPTLVAATAAATAPQGLDLLASRYPSLALANAAALPNGLATVAVEEAPAGNVHRWRYSASYAAGVFNPNVNFSRAGIEPEFDYNRGPAFGTDSPALTEAAATEYRNNLRPGLSQRIALLATRHLRGHWSLSTGAEFTQATAQSASSSAFVGEQLFDLGQAATERPLRTTDFRYRMASIPLEVRYSNPVKRGWSIYGRLGGVVTALLGVRSDVQGDPEATRTYSITSTGGPYRRLMGSLRGGAGTQFRPATGRWALSMGPVADLGLVALNAHPVQRYFAQSHPYSVGLEAAVEFGH